MKQECQHDWRPFTKWKAECGKCHKRSPWSDLLVAAGEELLGFETPWPITDVLRNLAGGVEHLLTDHACDVLGHEELRECMERARTYAHAIDLSRGALRDLGHGKDPSDGKCCDCGYTGGSETPCEAREDKTHCEHWWDGDS